MKSAFGDDAEKVVNILESHCEFASENGATKSETKDAEKDSDDNSNGRRESIIFPLIKKFQDWASSKNYSADKASVLNKPRPSAVGNRGRSCSDDSHNR